MEYGNVVTWILVIIGWFAVHKATLFREQRKENIDTILKIINEIRSIENLAVAFNLADKYSYSDCDSLIWRVNRVILTLQRVPLKFLNIPIDLLKIYRQELTRNTDYSAFSCQSHDSDIIIRIRHVTDELIDEIEIQRYLIYS